MGSTLVNRVYKTIPSLGWNVGCNFHQTMLYSLRSDGGGGVKKRIFDVFGEFKNLFYFSSLHLNLCFSRNKEK